MLKDVTIVAELSSSEPVRIDKYLNEIFPNTTRSFLSDAFAAKNILINGRPVKKSEKLSSGATILIKELVEQSDRFVVPVEGDLEIVFESSALIACNKPAGMDCHPITVGETGTLANALVARCPELAEVGDEPLMAGLLHRIDAGTSGLVVAAKDSATYDEIRKLFAERKVKKIYHAWVHGRVEAAGGVSGNMAHHNSFRGRMRCVYGPQPNGERLMWAETFYKPVEYRANETLLEITIYTGVTHQIRCQLASIGHPIVGDTLYGSPRTLRTTKQDGSTVEYFLLQSTAMALPEQTISLNSLPEFK
jgi:23S rRNA pseudouridine1911/1915/1917 synthase